MNIRARCAVIIGFACSILLLGAPNVRAQDFPTRQISIIIPYTAGGLSDIIARRLAKHLEEAFRQPVVVDNKVGGGGLPATEYVLKAPRDGHTLLFADMQQWAIAPATFKSLPYDPEKDFAGVTIIGSTEMFLIASTSVQATDLKDLMAKLRANPGKFNYGSSGVAGFQHLTIEAFRVGANVDIVHVAYRGGPQVMAAIAADEISMALQSWGQSQQLISQGKIKLIAVAAPKRAAVAPDVPTFTEMGVPGVDFPPAMGIVTGAGVRPQILERLAAEFRKAAAQPDMQETFKTYNMTQVYGAGPAETMAWIKSDREKLTAVVKASGLTPQ